MNLKHYQDNTLAAVKAYFERCAFESPEAAYKTMIADGDTRLRLFEPRGLSVAQQIEDALRE